MSHFNHKGRPGKVGGSLPSDNLTRLFFILKGGSGSGNFGHSGRPGKHGGSTSQKGTYYGTHKQEDVIQALSWVKDSILSSERMGSQKDLSEGAKDFLRETVETNPKLYRGIGIIKAKVKPENIEALNSLREGDVVPNILQRQSSDISSYTKKKGIANYYAEGKLSVVVEAQDKSKILLDLENLPKVLEKYKIPHKFDQDDFDYFKTDKEVFVLEPISAKVVKIKGRL